MQPIPFFFLSAPLNFVKSIPRLSLLKITFRYNLILVSFHLLGFFISFLAEYYLPLQPSCLLIFLDSYCIHATSRPFVLDQILALLLSAILFFSPPMSSVHPWIFLRYSPGSSLFHFPFFLCSPQRSTTPRIKTAIISFTPITPTFSPSLFSQQADAHVFPSSSIFHFINGTSRPWSSIKFLYFFYPQFFFSPPMSSVHPWIFISTLCSRLFSFSISQFFFLLLNGPPRHGLNKTAIISFTLVTATFSPCPQQVDAHVFPSSSIFHFINAFVLDQLLVLHLCAILFSPFLFHRSIYGYFYVMLPALLFSISHFSSFSSTVHHATDY
jgi:hypothetical protein